ncbi:MAG: molybdenum cofactor biosynthesis protein B [Candidatus Hydrothermarchaeota archaeon]
MHEVTPTKFRYSLITISTSRYEYLIKKRIYPRDESGDFIRERLRDYELLFYTIIPDDYGIIQSTINYSIRKHKPDVIITCGGTGLSKTDVTYEAVSDLVDKEIPGFGEFFRNKSYSSVKGASMITRAFAGIIEDTLIFSIPGSLDAVRIGMDLILDQISHLIMHVKGA